MDKISFEHKTSCGSAAHCCCSLFAAVCRCFAMEAGLSRGSARECSVYCFEARHQLTQRRVTSSPEGDPAKSSPVSQLAIGLGQSSTQRVGMWVVRLRDIRRGFCRKKQAIVTDDVIC